ncbi:MAG: tetratricopeptide repeat protein [Deltaproteobacteria bacterium]|nr:tetratricopeptide repeat protein [Deltaproteobacteria bacterium]
MRSLLVLVLLSAPLLAGTRALPPRLSKAAGDAFNAGQKADAKGDPAEAVKQYRRAYAIAPHADTMFNIADVQRRAKDYDGALTSYEKYLELAPDDPDRKVIEKLVAELRAMPGTLEIESDEPDGKVFVDGKYVGMAPIKVKVPAGTHQIDVITPITHGDMACPVSIGGSRDCRVGAKPRDDGNVVISGSWIMGGQSWPIGDQRFEVHGRFTVRPGRYELKIDDDQCGPLMLDVKAGDDLTFAYITFVNPKARGCRRFEIAQQQIKL